MAPAVTKARHRAGPGWILDGLDTTLLELVRGDSAWMDKVGGVVIYDAIDEPDLPPGALVLGIGLGSSGETAGVIARLGRERATGLVLRAPASRHPAVLAAAEASGVALLSLARGPSWNQLWAISRTRPHPEASDAFKAELMGAAPLGDLFELANAITALVDAPVTIEDHDSRVLAFSGRQEEADPARIQAIIGRQVPPFITRRFSERGVLGDLYRSDAPIWIDAEPRNHQELPRVAVAVKAGDEVLGSIWVAVSEPLSDDRQKALCDAAKLAALHILHIRAGGAADRRIRTDLLRTALSGGDGAYEALSRLGLSEHPVILFALSLLDTPESVTSFDGNAALATERQWISDGFALHLSAVHQRSTCALVGETTYALVPMALDKGGAEDRAKAVASGFLGYAGHRDGAVIAVGPVARTVAELAHSRATADRVLRVLRGQRGGNRNVARLADVHADVLIRELRDIVVAQGDEPTGPLARLIEHDREHGGNLVETLRAWLDAGGDVTVASTALYVHPNTFRYRLRRIAEVGDMSLSDNEAKFSAILQLRVLYGA